MARRRSLTAAAALGFTLLGIGAASAVPIGTVRMTAASHASHGKRVGDLAEAWYASPSGALCLPFVGCLPVPLPLPSTYPAGSLHVGVTLGAESARTYIVPAVAKHTGRLAATSGTLVLPVDTSPATGTLDFGSARIKACLVTGRLPATASAIAVTPGAPPAVDCKVSAPASFSRSGGYFYVDLARFLAKWRRGTPTRGIALVPNLAGAARTANWQVTILGKGSTGPTVHSLVTYTARDDTGPTPTPTPTATPSHSGALPPFAGPSTPGDDGIAPLPVSSPEVAPPATAAVYLVRSKGFRYPAIFVAPLAILAGVIFFGRLFTGSTFQPRPIPVGLGRSRPAPPKNGS
ncbi:MAG TPA: hypothetical protein VHV76_07365 [Mycobacteriales bacterium]|nr:hypothetical protein [Mycobacteriales bacterium]